MIKKGVVVNGANLLLLGITFKENCPDVRNTKIVDVVKALEDYGIQVTICDPWANPAEVQHEYNLTCHPELVSGTSATNSKFDAIVLGVAHKEFLALDLNSLANENSVIYDVKGILKSSIDGRL
jgi:UDP-N-acetyl-D-galactosamine dehydrogenase